MDNSIIVDSEVMNGNPCIPDKKITVFDIVSCCYEDTILTAKRDFGLNDIVIREVLSFCASKLCNGYSSYCAGCTLRLKQDSIQTMDDFVKRFSKVVCLGSGIEILSNGVEGTYMTTETLEELSNSWKGKNGWELACSVISKNEVSH